MELCIHYSYSCDNYGDGYYCNELCSGYETIPDDDLQYYKRAEEIK